MFVDKYGIDELRSQVEEELQGDWVAERDFSIEHRLFLDDEREGAPAPPASYGSPNGDLQEFERFRAANVRRAEAGGLRHGRGEGHPRRPHARAVPRPRADHARLRRRLRAHDRAAELRAALGARGERLRRLAGAVGARPRRRRARARSTTSSPARAPTAASSGSPARWASTQAVQERIEAMEIADELTRQINIKISGCPNGCGQHHVAQHRLHGRLDQGRRAHDPRLHPPRRRHLRRRRGQVRHAPEAAPARQAGARGGRALAPPLRGRAPGRRGVERRSSSGSAPASSRRSSRTCRCPSDFCLETMNQFIDWNRNVPFQVIRGEGECAV